jgi:hypothetical protein
MENNSKKSGKVGWDQPSYNGNNGETKKPNKDLFLKLRDGNNTIRIVTDPFQYYCHKSIKALNEQGFGTKINCSAENGSCPLCDLGSRPSPRYYIGVIDKATTRYQILDISWSVMSDVKAYAQNPIWGALDKFDIVIRKDPNNPSKYYTVSANPHTPLSPAEQKVRDEGVDLNMLEEKCKPYTAERVEKILASVLKGAQLWLPPKKEDKKSEHKASAVKSKMPPVVDLNSSDDEGDEDIFPAYQGKSASA